MNRRSKPTKRRGVGRQKSRTNPRREARFGEANVCFQRGDLDSAARLCANLLEKAPHAGAAHLLGHIAHARGDIATAEQLFRQSVAADPNFSTGHAALGVALQQLGRPADAVEHYRAALKHQPEDVQTLYNLGTAHKAAHDLHSAETAYARAAALAPHDPDNLAALGRTQIELGKLGDATDTYAELLERFPNAGPDVLESFAFCAVRSERAEEAERALKHAAHAFPDHIGLDIMRVCAHLALGEPDAAMPTIESIRARAPSEPQTLANLALAAGALDDRALAASLYDFDHLLHTGPLVDDASALGPEFDHIAALNQALIAHIENHPTLAFEQHSLSCHFGATSNELLVPPFGPVETLRRLLRERFDQYIAHLPAGALRDAEPRDQELSAWATILQSQGHQGGHIHPSAWLSGVYYVSLPDSVKSEDDEQGWIEFGQPPIHYRLPEAKIRRRIRPVEGHLCLFPSYFYHQTVPFEGQSPRVSIAFDLRARR
ncbi:MAG: TIGR02466 family protein [Pseudomonadota bacterium]